MNIIMLDFDGVMVSQSSWAYWESHGIKNNYRFLPDSVAALNTLIEYYNAPNIVICASARLSKTIDSLKKMMVINFIEGQVIGITGPQHKLRLDDIKEWVEENQNFERLIIVDDEVHYLKVQKLKDARITCIQPQWMGGGLNIHHVFMHVRHYSDNHQNKEGVEIWNQLMEIYQRKKDELLKKYSMIL